MSSIFGNVIDGLKKLMQALQAIEPAPNDTTVYFNDTVYCANPLDTNISGTYASDMVQLDDNGETVVLTSNSLAFTPPGGPTMGALWSDIINAVNPTLEDVLANGNSAQNEMSLFYTPNNSYTIYGGYGLIFDPNGSTNLNYRIAMDGTFLKVETGMSLRYIDNDTHVLRDYSFQVSSLGAPFNFDPYTNYLDGTGNVGWSTILSNQDGGDISISADIDFYSHATGFCGTVFNLKKYATARFTLVTCTATSSGYAWAVSMY